MKKIGICTLYEACNIGAISQAFALQEKLKELGYMPEFLKLKNCVIYDKNRETKEFRDMRKNLNISNKYYNPIEDNYDAIIVGSDEIWNIQEKTYKHIDEFIGYNLNAPKIIAYAPGANITNGEIFKQYYKGEKDLRNFTNLSARDTNALDIIKKVANVNAPIVLDPTFLIDSYEPYMVEGEEKDYILVYGWGFKDKEKQAIVNFSRKEKLPLYAVGHAIDSNWCDKFIGSNIFKFFTYMKKAKYVILSDTFHGMIFSLIFNKQFVAITNGRFKSRELIERVGLQNWDCERIEEIPIKIKETIDYNEVNKWIKEERQKSIEYLINAIE